MVRTVCYVKRTLKINIDCFLLIESITCYPFSKLVPPLIPATQCQRSVMMKPQVQLVDAAQVMSETTTMCVWEVVKSATHAVVGP